MKRAPEDARRVLWYQAIAFLGIIALCWLDEYLGLTHRLFGGAAVAPNWREALFETGFAGTIWAIAHYSVRRLLARVYYLERFVRICAWCRKINHGDEWVPLERFLELDSDTRTSHGVCPACEGRLARREVASSEESGASKVVNSQ